MNRGIGNYHNNGGKNSQSSNISTFQKGESINIRGGGSSNYIGGNNGGRGGRKKLDKSNV